MENKFIEEYIKLLNQFYQKYKKNLGDEKVGVMLSGGIDSSIIAYFTALYFPKTIFFTLGPNEKTDDLVFAKILAKNLKKNHQIINYQKEELKKIKIEVKKILKKIQINENPMQLSLACAFYLICQKVKKEKIKYLFCGQGPDILLAGYHKYKKILKDKLNQQIKTDLSLLEVDKKRDKQVAKYFQIKLINPYLEKEFVDFSLKIPSFLKINKIKNEVYEKYLSRKVGERLKLPKEIIYRHKKALQYSTKIMKYL